MTRQLGRGEGKKTKTNPKTPNQNKTRDGFVPGVAKELRSGGF